MNLIDTNIIIRFLTDEDKELIEKAKAILFDSPDHSLELTTVVFCEIAFVLSTFYQVPKDEVIRDLALLISLKSISCDQSLLRTTLQIFEKHSISIVDAYLLSRKKLGKNDKLFTFDKRLEKISAEGGLLLS